MAPTLWKRKIYDVFKKKERMINPGEEGVIRVMSEPRFKHNTRLPPKIECYPEPRFKHNTRLLTKKGQCNLSILKALVKFNDKTSVKVNDKASGKFIDGLSSSCGNERIIVSTTDHRDRHDAALLPMDTYIHKASPQPVGLPDGGEIVQVQSIGEKSLLDFDATNNRGQSAVLVSNSKKKYTLEVSRERCMTQSLLSLVESTRRTSTDFDSPDNREHLNSPVVFNSEKEDTREASKGECLTKNALSLDDSTKQNSFPDFEATINKAHLVEAYHSGPVVSLSENKNSGGALNRECIGKSVLCLEDLRQHCGGRCDDVEKSFGAISDPGFRTTDSLAWTSFEVLETLVPWEQPNDCVPLVSLGRSTLGSCVQQEKSPDLPRFMQIDAVGQRVTKSPRYLEGFTAQSASSSLWPIGLPDGRHIVVLDPLEQSTKNVAHAARVDQCSPTVSLLEKKMQSHHIFCVVATCIGKKHGTNQVSTVKCIHKQHRIHQWPFRHKWATRKRYSVGDKRSFQVSRESMNEKLDSRLQFIHMSQCAKADGSGPTMSNSEALKYDSLTNTRSLNDLREHFGARRKDAAKGLCDSVALKSFEVLDSLPLGEQSNSIRNLARRRTLTHKHCVRLKKSQDLRQSLLSDCSRELVAQAALAYRMEDISHLFQRRKLGERH